MDSVAGFFFSRVAYRSSSEPEVFVDLGTGGNVIAGASNTGKSYFFHSIDFMLGSSDVPKDIPEAAKYDTVVAELETYRGDKYRLTRAIKGGDFKLEVLTGNPREQLLGEKHNAKDEDNISTFLLKLAGLDGHKVLKNQAGDLQNVTFRTLVPLYLVDEQRILDTRSPVLSGQLIFRTVERNTFRLLVTGADDSTVLAKPARRKSGNKQIDGDNSVLDKLITSMEAEIAAVAPNETMLLKRAQQLDKSIAALLAAMNLDATKVTNNRKILNDSFETLVKSEQRSRFISELLARLALLDEQYDSDMERLRAIAEVHHYFGQLRTEKCPVCGAPPESHDPEVAWHLNPETDYEQIVAACGAEISKIETLKRDLNESIGDLKHEKDALDKGAQKLRQAYATSIQAIEQELQPRMESTQAELSQLIQSRSRFAAVEAIVPRLLEIRKHRADGTDKPRELASLASKPPQSEAVEEFTIVVEELLKEWNYPDLSRVTFNQERLDIIISGKDRGNQGKGLRAIGYAAFVLGLMRYCRRKNLPHPGFVVLDSPLVTYQKPDDRPEDLLSNDVKDAFFRSLSIWPSDQQVIILENEEPPEDVKTKLKYLHFSGTKDVNRYGLFPIRGQ
jgi:hypothetical protein